MSKLVIGLLAGGAALATVAVMSPLVGSGANTASQDAMLNVVAAAPISATVTPSKTKIITKITPVTPKKFMAAKFMAGKTTVVVPVKPSLPASGKVGGTVT